MEFSPRKAIKTAVQTNVYGSSGKIYLDRFHRKSNKVSVPNINPIKKLKKYSPSVKSLENKTSSSYEVKHKSNHILQNSQVQNSTNDSPNSSSKWLPKPIYNNSNSSHKRKKLHPTEIAHTLDTSADPYNVFTDEENDDEVILSSKYPKITKCNVDKENNNVASYPSKYFSKANIINITPKRKSLNLVKSSLLHDVSPEKVKLALGSVDKRTIIKNDAVNLKLRQTVGKENLSVEKAETNLPEIEHPHMIGFPNFGNTCYLNAVTQTLVSLQPLVGDLSNIIEEGVVSSGSVTHSLWNIIVARQKLDWAILRSSLRTLKKSVGRIDGSFSGFKMQDANEFLTQVLDMVKDEIIKFTSQKSSHSIGDSQCTPKMDPCENLLGGAVKERSVNSCKSSRSLFRSLTSSTSPDKCTASIFDTPSSSSSLSLEINVKENGEHILSDEDIVFLTPKQTKCVESNAEHSEHSLTNPVISNFEFELLESFRCLGCGETEGRKQKHFALYVDLPEEGDESIQKAIERYMDEDHRDLTCDKCGHERASFLTSFLQVPRFLIVQMKRYEYKPKQHECIKVSSRVDVNTWVHLDEFTSLDTSLPPDFLKGFLRKELKYNGGSQSPPCKPIPSSLNSSFVDRAEVQEEEAAGGAASSSNWDSTTTTTTKNKEDDQLEEVILRSLEDVDNGNLKVDNSADKEEEELQRAIKLSLQDMGTAFNEKPAAEGDNQTTQKAADSLQEEKTGKHSYHLLSIISHFGLTTCTGHYVSDVLHIKEDKWYHYDDECVSSLPESVVLAEARQKNGYVFFYVHREIYNVMRSSKT